VRASDGSFRPSLDASGSAPFRQRVFITDGRGAGGIPFTIPTAAIRTAIPTLLSALGGGLIAGPAGAALAGACSSTR
jgi:hypothetical protein